MDDTDRRYSRNALDAATSPYLRQHADNPVWWQEWRPEVLDWARRSGRPLLVSVGYATCHWCHVMAAEAFSDEKTAQIINDRFVAIKVDREERPDIDHWLMQFLLATRGQGGWPLNAFLTSDARPLVALTYLPATARSGVPAFADVAGSVAAFVRDHPAEVPSYDLWASALERAGVATDSPETTAGDRALASAPPAPGATRAELDRRTANLRRRFDGEWAGFGSETKFPPHSTLLYLISMVEHYHDESARVMVTMTLDRMAQRGLHDHLQGGIYRYCVDRAWTIPHFEKMLYDQAMALWVYARAASVMDNEWYASVASEVVRCLEESFARPDGLFISAHDADTDHSEGATYLWSAVELADLIGDELAGRLFDLGAGAFEGRIHLIRRDGGAVGSEERRALDRLLAVRRARVQPATDDKIVTAWNALAAIALVEAARALGRPELVDRARSVRTALLSVNAGRDGALTRATRNGAPPSPAAPQFLEDYAAVLLLTCYLAEEAPTLAEAEELLRDADALAEQIATFRTDRLWLTSRATDLPPVPADTFDSPTPSPSSLAETALLHHAHMRGRMYRVCDWQPEQVGDFHNLAVMLSEGQRYIITSPTPLDRSVVPGDTLRVPAPAVTTCHSGVCRPGLVLFGD